MKIPFTKAKTRWIEAEPDAAKSRQRRRIVAYASTIVVVFMAWLVRWLLDPWLDDKVIYFTFFFGVLVAGWYGGLGPAVVAAALSSLVGNYFFVDPRYTWLFNEPESLQSAARFMMIGAATGYFSGRLRAAERQAHDKSEEVLRQQVRLEHEVDERRRTENALREREERFRLMAEALRVADVRKDEFLATLAHELRNPLAPIRNALEIMRLAGSNAELVGEARGVMERQVQQMVRLVDDLLDLSRITTGKVELRTERILLGAAVNDALEIVRPAVAEHRHELTVSLPPEPIFLEADQTRLAQVFANLLGNACKYTPRGGRIELVARQDGEEVEVSVIDSGIGIPPEALPGLFEMFAQVDRSLERGHRGLGVGLALVRGFVEMHNGTVTAHSEGIDRGSTFTVRLPIATLTASKPLPLTPTTRSAATRSAATPQQRILVVDDNLDATETLATMLMLLGHEVQTATDGLSALDMAEAFRPAVVVLDIGLPELNGYDTARRLRDTPWARDILLIAVTGWGQAADKRRAKEAGFDFHLTKPVDRHDLERLLGHTHVPSPKHARELQDAGA